MRPPPPSERRAILSPRLAFALAPALALVLIAVSVWNITRSDAVDPVAVVSVVVGEVEQRGSETDAWRPVQPGDVLPASSQVLSRGSGMAIVNTETGTTLMVAPETTLTFQGPSDLSVDRGRIFARAHRGIRIVTAAGIIRTDRAEGRIALRTASEGRIDVEVSGFDAAWETAGREIPIAQGGPVALAPGGSTLTASHWAEGDWGWVQDLEEARARQLLRETHPSLLPEPRTSR